MSGLDVLAQIAIAGRSAAGHHDDRRRHAGDAVAIVPRQAHRFIRKPFPPRRIVEIVSDVLAALPPWPACRSRSSPPCPEWVEIVAPCSLEVGERVREFVMQLDATLPVDVRESVAQAFRELLTNAIEWGGHLDPQRTVRISCIRTRRMLLYRIADPGEGFDISGLDARGDLQSRRRSARPRSRPPGDGTSAWRPRPGDDARLRRRRHLQREAQRSRAREVSGLSDHKTEAPAARARGTRRPARRELPGSLQVSDAGVPAAWGTPFAVSRCGISPFRRQRCAKRQSGRPAPQRNPRAPRARGNRCVARRRRQYQRPLQFRRQPPVRRQSGRAACSSRSLRCRVR